MTDHAQHAAGSTIQSLLSTHMTAFDIGANKGHLAEAMSALCHKVVAFEPNPVLAQDLWNRMPANVIVEPVAMSDQDGTAILYVDERPGQDGLASSLSRLEGMEAMTRQVEVRTRTLDSYCAEKGLYPDFIKIDVEGFEPQVFAGGMQTIAVRRPMVLFEFWESHYDSFRPWFEAISRTHDMRRVTDHLDAVTWYAENRSDGIVDILCLPR